MMNKINKLIYLIPTNSLFFLSTDPLMVDKLPKTRSGRPIIPPLSYWTGQRVWINPNTQRVDILPGSKNVLPELTLSFTDNSVSIF